MKNRRLQRPSGASPPVSGSASWSARARPRSARRSCGSTGRPPPGRARSRAPCLDGEYAGREQALPARLVRRSSRHPAARAATGPFTAWPGSGPPTPAGGARRSLGQRRARARLRAGGRAVGDPSAAASAVRLDARSASARACPAARVWTFAACAVDRRRGARRRAGAASMAVRAGRREPAEPCAAPTAEARPARAAARAGLAEPARAFQRQARGAAAARGAAGPDQMRRSPPAYRRRARLAGSRPGTSRSSHRRDRVATPRAGRHGRCVNLPMRAVTGPRGAGRRRTSRERARRVRGDLVPRRRPRGRGLGARRSS